MTGCVAAALRETVKDAWAEVESPSVTLVSATERATGGPSSFRIVPTPRPSAMVALVGTERSTKNVSAGSAKSSPTTVTVTPSEVSPGTKVSSPVPAA